MMIQEYYFEKKLTAMTGRYLSCNQNYKNINVVNFSILFQTTTRTEREETEKQTSNYIIKFRG